jgi:hypothetical protein
MSAPTLRPLSTTQWRAVIDAAVRAPSSHNSQPWIVRIGGDGCTLEVFADRSRSIPINDPRDRELTISCGALVLGVEVALADAGCGSAVEILPSPGDPDHLARVTCTERPSWRLATLAPFLASRSTYRKDFGPGLFPGDVRQAMIDVAASYGCTLVPLDDAAQRADVIALVVDGDRAQFADPAWREELAAWLMPASASSGMATPVARLARKIVEHVDMGEHQSARDVARADQAPLLAVLATVDDSVAAWVSAGRALHHTLLVAASKGIQASFLNQPCQVEPLRASLAERIGLAAPQCVLRAGYPMTAVRSSGRRTADEVLETAPA